MPSLSNRERKVLRYFNKYGFNDVVLTLYVLNTPVTISNDP